MAVIDRSPRGQPSARHEHLQTAALAVDNLIAALRASERGSIPGSSGSSKKAGGGGLAPSDKWNGLFMYDNLDDFFNLRDVLRQSLQLQLHISPSSSSSSSPSASASAFASASLPLVRFFHGGTGIWSQEFAYQQRARTYFPFFFKTPFYMGQAVTVLCVDAGAEEEDPKALAHSHAGQDDDEDEHEHEQRAVKTNSSSSSGCTNGALGGFLPPSGAFVALATVAQAEKQQRRRLLRRLHQQSPPQMLHLHRQARVNPAQDRLAADDDDEDQDAGAYEIRFTLDGSPVTRTSQLYTRPLFLASNTTINALAFPAAGGAGAGDAFPALPVTRSIWVLQPSLG